MRLFYADANRDAKPVCGHRPDRPDGSTRSLAFGRKLADLIHDPLLACLTLLGMRVITCVGYYAVLIYLTKDTSAAERAKILKAISPPLHVRRHHC